MLSHDVSPSAVRAIRDAGHDPEEFLSSRSHIYDRFGHEYKTTAFYYGWVENRATDDLCFLVTEEELDTGRFTVRTRFNVGGSLWQEDPDGAARALLEANGLPVTLENLDCEKARLARFCFDPLGVLVN